MDYGVIVLCAGQGTRTGLSYNKMLYQFEGRTVYEMTLQYFIEDVKCQQIVVVTREDERQSFETLCQSSKIQFVSGGKERQDSVYAGLQLVKSDYVLVHDGARPYYQGKHIEALLACLKEHKACLLMVPCKDTIKKVEDGKVIETLDRSSLMQAQTPQAFDTQIILNAYEKGIRENYQATDDAQMLEHFGDEDVYVVLGDYENKKITTQEDLK